jgi:signal transduction histidine kinase
VSTEPPRRRRGISIRARLVAVVLVAVIPGFVLAFIAAANARRDARQRAETQTTVLVSNASERFSQLIGQADTLLSTMGEVSADQLSPAACTQLLALLAQELSVYDAFVITTPEGDVTCAATQENVEPAIKSSEWFQEAKRTGEFTVAQPDVAEGGDSKLWVSRAIQDQEGNTRAVLAARFSLSALGDELTPRALSQGAALTILGNGTILYDRGSGGVEPGTSVGDTEVVREIRADGSFDSLVADGVDGVSRVYSYEQLPEPSGLTVLSGVPTSIAFEQANRDFRTRILWLALSALIAMAVAFKLGDLMIGLRLRSLVGVTRRIAAGDLSARSDATGGSDEIGELETSLDAMAQEIERRDDERLRLLGNVVEAAEAERSRIAGDVHDDSIQVMTAHLMALQLIRRRATDPELQERLTELEDSARAAIARLRDLVFDLHSPVLEELGLGPAIEAFCERTFEGEPVRWSVANRLPSDVPVPARDTAYRVAQEALQNARRHAAPSRVTVTLERDGDELVAQVSDDGRGFAPDLVGNRPGHRGLLGARERAEAAGGGVEIVSEPGKGTTVTCRIPWRLGVQDEAESPVPVS